MWEGIGVTESLLLHRWSHSLLLTKGRSITLHTRWGHTTHVLLPRWSTRCAMLLVCHATVSGHTMVRRTIRVLSHRRRSGCALHARI
jgi:hypothetical protein